MFREGNSLLKVGVIMMALALALVIRALASTLGKKVGSPTSAAKVMTSRSELGSRCIETLRKFPEPQAGQAPRRSRSPRQNGSEGR